MKVRRMAGLLLCLGILLGLLSGCGKTGDAPEIAGENTAAVMDGELQRAYDAGLLPDEWLDDLTAAVTFREYSAVTTRLIQLWDENRLAEWTDTVSRAAGSDERMTREDGFLMLSYVWVLMGYGHEEIHGYVDERINPNTAYTEELRNAQGEELSWSYPLFPDWEDQVYDVFGANYMWGAVVAFPEVLSPVSGEFMFTWDESGSLRLQDKFTRDDAVRSLVRMADYCKVELVEDWGDYVSLADAGTYNADVLTEELLNAPSALPEVTQAALPATWKGAGIAHRKGSAEEYLHFSETDVRFLAENGFNFTRLFFVFETLRYPDYPADPAIVNRNELEELDQLLAWCVQYGVHLQIAMRGYLDEQGHNTEEMPVSDQQWALIRDYWTMLAKRYAGIPSRYLSFDLCNEVQPEEEAASMAYAKDGLVAVVDAIRGADPDRVLLYSLESNGSLAWAECFASLGVAIGYHPYWTNFITAADYSYMENSPYAQPCWPQPYFPMGLAMEGDAPVVLRGAVSGGTLSFHIGSSNESPQVSVYADGMLLKTFAPTDGSSDENGDYLYGDALYSVDIPAGTEEITLQVGQGGHYTRLDTVILENNGVRTVMVPSDTCDYPDYGRPLPLIVNGDGTYANSEGRVFDEDYIYINKVKPYRDIAEANGVGFMVNEFGMYGTKVYWDIGTVTAFHETYLKMLEKYELGWCYCESAGTKHLTIPYGNAAQWEGSTVEEITYSYEDGRTDTIKVCKELLEVFQTVCGS